MKPLDQLNNVERAKLLFELFPQQMPGLIECIKVMAETICNDPDKLRQQWNGQILAAGFWIQLAADARRRIDKNGSALLKSSRRFSDQLFDGYNALFAVHCLQQYTKTEKDSDSPFTKVVELLFNHNIKV